MILIKSFRKIREFQHIGTAIFSPEQKIPIFYNAIYNHKRIVQTTRQKKNKVEILLKYTKTIQMYNVLRKIKKIDQKKHHCIFKW